METFMNEKEKNFENMKFSLQKVISKLETQLVDTKKEWENKLLTTESQLKDDHADAMKEKVEKLTRDKEVWNKVGKRPRSFANVYIYTRMVSHLLKYISTAVRKDWRIGFRFTACPHNFFGVNFERISSILLVFVILFFKKISYIS